MNLEKFERGIWDGTRSMKGSTIGAFMTIMQKLKQLYPNHHHRVQPKPNTAPLTAEETIYQCHVRPKDVKEDTLWELVAEGLHKDVHAKLDGMDHAMHLD